MALCIRNPQAEKLAREIAALSGKNITQVVITALEYQADALRRRKASPDMIEEIMRISRRCSAIPDRDTRSPDEILGYDPFGVNES